MPAAPANGLSYDADIVGNLGDQNHVGAAGDARAQRQPTCAVAHYLGNDDPMMAMGSAVQPVDSLGGDTQRRIETEGRIRHRDVVVDSFWKCQDMQTLLGQTQSILQRAT